MLAGIFRGAGCTAANAYDVFGCVRLLAGIFRDSFQNVVELLDDLFERAANAQGETDEQNYIAKHSRAMRAQVRRHVRVPCGRVRTCSLVVWTRATACAGHVV